MSQNDRDPDDWFDEPRVESPPRRRPRPSTRPTGRRLRESADDDWIQEPAPRRLEAVRRVALPRLLLLVALLALVGLFAALAAFGVFSSGTHRASPPPPTTGQTTQPTTTTVSAGPTAPPAPTTTLKPGGSGSQVEALQRALNYLGFSVGRVDGAYGPATQKAVTRFQQSKGLASDGVVGPKTLQALTAALSP